MKKRIAIIALLVIGIAVLSAGTLAYFTSQTTAHNVITSGGVTIVLEEWADEVGGDPYPADRPMSAMPGQSVTKIVTVRNTDADAYVRAKFSITVFKNGEQIDPPENLSDAVVIQCGRDWELKDGWYYYKEPLKVGESTSPLFSEVVFDGPGMTNEYQNCTINVDVTAQAVQAANNGKSVAEAKGWPTEPTKPAEPEE